MPRALIVQHGANLDGSAISGLLLADGLRERGYETHVLFGFAGPVISRYEDRGHAAQVVDHKNWLRAGTYLRFLRTAGRELLPADKIVKAIDDLQPDIVYVNSAVSLAGAIAARRRRLPCIWHLRELFADVGGEMRVPGGFKSLARTVISVLSDLTVVNSRAVAENMLGSSRSSSTVIVPNAAGQEFFNLSLSKKQARAELGLPQDRVILGVPGTLRPMKGHTFVFDAIPAIRERIPELYVPITGGTDGPYAKTLMDAVKRSGLGSTVRFMGSVERMPAFYQACDAVCIPSRSEPFGRTVIEAFASGIPVVASAVGGIREIVTHDQNGLLVEFGATSALADAIVRVLSDRKLAARLSSNARRDSEERYTEEKYKDTLASLVDKVIAERSPTKVSIAVEQE